MVPGGPNRALAASSRATKRGPRRPLATGWAAARWMRGQKAHRLVQPSSRVFLGWKRTNRTNRTNRTLLALQGPSFTARRGIPCAMTADTTAEKGGTTDGRRPESGRTSKGCEKQAIWSVLEDKRGRAENKGPVHEQAGRRKTSAPSQGETLVARHVTAAVGPRCCAMPGRGSWPRKTRSQSRLDAPPELFLLRLAPSVSGRAEKRDLITLFSTTRYRTGQEQPSAGKERARARCRRRPRGGTQPRRPRRLSQRGRCLHASTASAAKREDQQRRWRAVVSAAWPALRSRSNTAALRQPHFGPGHRSP